MFITLLPPISTSWVTIPINENTRIFPSVGTRSSYFPSKPVVVPTVVPFTRTVTPGIVVPSSASVTVPVTFVCANATCNPPSKMNASKIVNFLII